VKVSYVTNYKGAYVANRIAKGMRWRPNETKIEIEMFSVQSMCTVRETAHCSLEEDFSIAITEPRGLAARFLNDITTAVEGSGDLAYRNIRGTARDFCHTVQFVFLQAKWMHRAATTFGLCCRHNVVENRLKHMEIHDTILYLIKMTSVALLPTSG